MSDVNIYRQFEETHKCYMSDEYALHSDRMTREGLHSKSDIALELAYRDITIASLQEKLSNVQSEGRKLIKATDEMIDDYPGCRAIKIRLNKAIGKFEALLDKGE